jgi:hypothetical protein
MAKQSFSKAAEEGLKRWAKARGFSEVKESLAGKPGISTPEALAAWLKLRSGGKGDYVKKMRKAGALKEGAPLGIAKGK